jgi:multidrug resistance protein, MATE family
MMKRHRHMAMPGTAAIWRAEFAATITLAVPIALTQLGQVAMMTTDLALIGRVGDRAVGAAALGHAVLFSAFMLCLGLASAVAPLASQAVGARQPRTVRSALHAGLWAITLIGVPLTVLQLQASLVLVSLGQSAEVAVLAGRYLDGVAWSMMPACWFIALRSFMSAVDRPQPAFWITLAAIPANAALAYALIHGAWGLPRLDLLGAGLATTVVNLSMCVAGAWVALTQGPFRKFRLLGGFWCADRKLLGELMVLGLPISATYLLEYSLFAFAAVMMGWISTNALVGHQIALQVASIVFMVPLGISLAATVRVGHAVGRRDLMAARRAAFAAILLGVIFMGAVAILTAVFRREIPALFLGGDAEAQTVALAASLLVLGATFFVADGIQTITIGALRGLNDTQVPLLFSALSFWLFGFSASYVLAFNFGMGASGVWIGLSLAVFIYATLLITRLLILLRRPNLLATALVHTP